MNQIQKSIENCQIQPLTPRRVTASDVSIDEEVNSVGCATWICILACIGGLILLANIEEDKLWWIWLLPFVVATIARFWFLSLIREKKAKKDNEEYRQRSLQEAGNKTNRVKIYVTSSLEIIEQLKQNSVETSALINQARSEFRENAYSPFWDKIHESIAQMPREH